MKTPKVKQCFIPVLVQEAKDNGEAAEHVVEQIFHNGELTTAIYKCGNCKSEIEADIGSRQGYCDFCESVVFLDKV